MSLIQDSLFAFLLDCSVVWSEVSLLKSVLVKENVSSGQKKDFYDLSLKLGMSHNPRCPGIDDVQNNAILKSSCM